MPSQTDNKLMSCVCFADSCMDPCMATTDQNGASITTPKTWFLSDSLAIQYYSTYIGYIIALIINKFVALTSKSSLLQYSISFNRQKQPISFDVLPSPQPSLKINNIYAGSFSKRLQDEMYVQLIIWLEMQYYHDYDYDVAWVMSVLKCILP